MRRQASPRRHRREWWRASALLFRPLALAAGVFVSAPAAAQEYVARDVGDWALAASEDGSGCFLSRRYDGVGNTTLLLGLDVDGTNRLSMLNDNWSIAPKARLKLDFRLSNGGYVSHAAVGLASNGQKGFVTTFDATFPTYFATSVALFVSRGDVPVARLSLAGSGAAVAELRRCVDAHRAGAGGGAGETDPADLVPKDPFAPRPTRRAKR